MLALSLNCRAVLLSAVAAVAANSVATAQERDLAQEVADHRARVEQSMAETRERMEQRRAEMERRRAEREEDDEWREHMRFVEDLEEDERRANADADFAEAQERHRQKSKAFQEKLDASRTETGESVEKAAEKSSERRVNNALLWAKRSSLLVGAAVAGLLQTLHSRRKRHEAVE